MPNILHFVIYMVILAFTKDQC